MDIVEEGRLPPVATLYHLTRLETVPSIKTNGLQPSYSQAPTHYPRAIYLSGDMTHAGAFAGAFHKASPATGYVLLTVNVADLDPQLLGADDADLEKVLADRGGRREWTQVSWRESIRLCGQCTYRGWIKRESIEVLACMVLGEPWKNVSQPLSAWTPPNPNDTTDKPEVL